MLHEYFFLLVLVDNMHFQFVQVGGEKNYSLYITIVISFTQGLHKEQRRKTKTILFLQNKFGLKGNKNILAFFDL